MSISISDTRPTRRTGHDDDVFRRAMEASASTADRFVVVEGPRGSGKSHALTSIAAAARADGHAVVRWRSADGDPVITAASFGPWLALVRGADSGAPRPSRSVVLVDDFHALAEGARNALRQALAELAQDPSTVVVVAVDDRRVVPGWIDLQYVPLRPLGDTAAEELLRRDRVDLPASRIAMLLRLADGNPSLLHTVGRAWADGSVADRSAPFPTAYPQPGAPTDAVARTVDALTDEARSVALGIAVASVEFPGDDDGWDVPDTPPLDAPLRGLVAEGSTGLTFRDPYVRLHLLSSAPPAELRRVRSLVARSKRVPERLRLLAVAGASPTHDDDLVPRLLALVDESLRLRRPHDATATLLEAARLTTSVPLRGQLRARAAAVAAFVGDFGLVDAEAERAAHRDAQPDPVLVGAVEFVRALRSGDVGAGRRAVLAALDGPDRTGTDDVLVATLHVLCSLHGDGSWWDEALEVTAGRDLDPVLRLVEDCVDGSRLSEDERAALHREARVSAADAQPWKAVALHVAWTLLDPTDPRREVVDAVLRRTGDAGLLGCFASYRGAVAAYQAGRLDAAGAGFDHVRESAERRGADTLVALTDALQALVHSVRGEPEQTARKADRAARWAVQHGTPLVTRAAEHARSSLDVATGRFEEAHARSTTGHRTTRRWLASSYGPVELLDAVESAARLRMTDHGTALVTAAERALGARCAPRESLIVTTCRAVLGTDADSRTRFEDALATVDDDVAPFEVARVRLAYGEWLRRDMHALEARTQFRLAARAFEVLGARHWQLRAEHELRVAGGAGVPTGSVDLSDLSEQERRVASLAAAGLTNKQIGGQLFLSPRTVSGHLYRLFPKLGVSTRAGLRDALVALGAPGAPGPDPDPQGERP
ncbi:LuxR C-terminal-related transcriptional regulator [Curtobacterium sp. VKM Ac-1376]|uniref:LuxR C-terminal-related transcriptional regulator n=1 Tax=Curtobacterium sp. VKM Ac-1376 TaxID=123312 RepID=UPI00188CC97E|nr:LuxR C-terminal-related transcriptional regulator [Curtobacterium sp. VKM Ac-1376]MBF4613433.1 hypothetical protein [Curtobacterium sp. VKM Ac-1376]